VNIALSKAGLTRDIVVSYPVIRYCGEKAGASIWEITELEKSDKIVSAKEIDI
jgi:hypothetical protein